MYSVYCLTTKDGRRYVGTTSMPVSRRWNNGNGYRFCKDLWSVICNEGWSSIEKTVVATDLSAEEASELEQKLIAEFRTYDPLRGFNREYGGINGRKIIPEEVRLKMSRAETGIRNHNHGTHFTEEHKAKIRKSNLGQKRSVETCHHIGLSKQKAVNQFTTSGKFVARWESGRKAALATGTQAGHISKVCKHQRCSAGGYVWAYAE